MKAEKGIKMFVFHYKPSPIIASLKGYVHIWAGQNEAPNSNGLVSDSTGDHISEKNKYYSELTGIYWVWKNTDATVVGTCHYRRYFSDHQAPYLYRLKRLLFWPLGLHTKRHGLIYTNNFNYWGPRILSTEKANNYLEKFDIVLPVKRKLKYSVEEHYQRYHNIKDFEQIKQIVAADCPEFLNAFDSVMKGKGLYANNMFILNRDRFESLNKWLFHILFRFEKQIDLKEYKQYQERIFGFLSERLITVWVHHQQLSIKELPLIYFKKLKPEK